MIYAQFYQPEYNGGPLVEVPNEQGIFALDGRNNRATHLAVTKAICAERKFLAFSLHGGRTRTRSVILRPMEHLFAKTSYRGQEGQMKWAKVQKLRNLQ